MHFLMSSRVHTYVPWSGDIYNGTSSSCARVEVSLCWKVMNRFLKSESRRVFLFDDDRSVCLPPPLFLQWQPPPAVSNNSSSELLCTQDANGSRRLVANFDLELLPAGGGRIISRQEVGFFFFCFINRWSIIYLLPPPAASYTTGTTLPNSPVVELRGGQGKPTNWVVVGGL